MTRSRVALLAAGIAAAALLVVVLVVSSRPATAAQTALAYLRALTSDSADALRDTVELSDAAAAAFEQADAHLSSPEVVEVEEKSGTAAAHVSFVLDGQQRDATLLLRQYDGTWRVDPSTALGRLTVAAPVGTGFMIGGRAFPLGSVALVPAVYTGGPAPWDVREGAAAATVLPGEPTASDLEPMLTPEARAEAADQVTAHLETCTQSASTVPEGCGIRVPWAVDLAEATRFDYRIEKQPVLEVDTTEFRADGGELVVTVTGTSHDGAGASVTYRNDEWTLRGSVVIDDDGLTLAAW